MRAAPIVKQNPPLHQTKHLAMLVGKYLRTYPHLRTHLRRQLRCSLYLDLNLCFNLDLDLYLFLMLFQQLFKMLFGSMFASMFRQLQASSYPELGRRVLPPRQSWAAHSPAEL
jgi:hypothetical protein